MHVRAILFSADGTNPRWKWIECASFRREPRDYKIPVPLDDLDAMAGPGEWVNAPLPFNPVLPRPSSDELEYGGALHLVYRSSLISSRDNDPKEEDIDGRVQYARELKLAAIWYYKGEKPEPLPRKYFPKSVVVFGLSCPSLAYRHNPEEAEDKPRLAQDLNMDDFSYICGYLAQIGFSPRPPPLKIGVWQSVLTVFTILATHAYFVWVVQPRYPIIPHIYQCALTLGRLKLDITLAVWLGIKEAMGGTITYLGNFPLTLTHTARSGVRTIAAIVGLVGREELVALFVVGLACGWCRAAYIFYVKCIPQLNFRPEPLEDRELPELLEE
jgi:hypothetical protein